MPNSSFLMSSKDCKLRVSTTKVALNVMPLGLTLHVCCSGIFGSSSIQVLALQHTWEEGIHTCKSDVLFTTKEQGNIQC